MPDSPYDLAFPLPRASEPGAWAGLGRLFLPSRPHLTGAGRRVWLRHQDRFILSATIEGIVEDDDRVSTVDGSDFGPGLSLLVDSNTWRRRNRLLEDVADPDGVGASWQRGLRYLRPGGRAFVRARPGAPNRRDRQVVRVVPLDRPGTEPVSVVTKAGIRQAEQTEAVLRERFRVWALGEGELLQGLEMDVPGGTLRADIFHDRSKSLIEVKAQASRAHLRLAVGQLLDYAAHLPFRPSLVVLVPEEPTEELQLLLDMADVDAVWPSDDGFAGTGEALDRLA